MAFYKHYIIPFKSLRQGTDYTVNIYKDGSPSGGVKTIDGAADTFTTEEDDDEDMFTPMRTQSGTLRDTIRNSIDVPIPIVQKRYEDSLYTAWVSGFEPKLDSIRLYTPEIQTTVTKTVYEPTPLLTLGVQVGGGYGLIHRQPDIYVGIGWQINLWPRRKRH